MAHDAAPLRDARAVDAAVPRPHGLLGRLAPHRDPDRARTALPREVRARRRRQQPNGHAPRRRGRHLRRRRSRQLGNDLRRDVHDRLGRRAHPRRPPQAALLAPAATVARLLRAQPRRRDHQPAHERRRGDRPARHRRRHDPRAEHAHACRHGDPPLRARLASRARDVRGDPAHERRDGRLPAALGARVRCRAGAPGLPHRHARRGHRGHARRAGVHARATPRTPTSARSPSVTASRTCRRSC